MPKEPELKSTIKKCHKPKISVILPTFNRARTIRRAINSVLKQSFGDFELTIIDDASTDNTHKIINSYEDKRIIYLKKRLHSQKTKENVRNDGLRIARGKYIAYIDSDNRWLKDHLKILYQHLEKNKDIGMVYCDSRMFKDNKKTDDIIHWNKAGRLQDFDRKLLMKESFIDIGEVMHKKSQIEKVGLWKYDGYYGDDWDFFKRMSKYYKIKHIKKILCDYYSRDSVKNAKYFLYKAKEKIRQNKRVTPKSIKLLKRAIESSRKCLLKKDRKEIKSAKEIIAAAKAIIIFKNKKEVLSIL